MSDKPTQAVKWEVGVTQGQVVISFSTEGVPTFHIPMNSPQAAHDMAEALSRAAHMAAHGTPLESDKSYLHAEMKKRVTREMQSFLINRVKIMLNSLRMDRNWSNEKLAHEVVDQVLAKVT